jgi:phosphoribosylformylglycinamidine synthase subunit PurL
LGFVLNMRADLRADAYLFGEAQSRIVVSVSAHQEQAFLAACAGINIEALGEVTANEIIVGEDNWGAVNTWNELYEGAIWKVMTN